ncbi:hypothetical protein BYT27DRAFT_7202813 [Phlegmacium glaucopus]|nr:hypothetical protein BYT27DRAFT_7202813 [Phlegmacium glaucopus]
MVVKILLHRHICVGIDRLYEKVAPGAFHNSSERYDPPKCHPGTREIIIKEIMDWIETIDKDEFFLWLYGPAGAGKSAIAQTIAELCHKVGLLAASFFFSRTASGRNDATLLIPTLSYQLTISIPEIVRHISMAIEIDPLIFHRSLEVQFEALILKPLSALPSKHNHSSKESKIYPRLIIIDGLDECNNAQNSHCSILSTLSSLQHSSVPLIFLVASRPEQDIRSVFNQERMDSITRRLVLDDHYQPDEDIRRFLISKFEEIKAKHLLALHLPPSWPSPLEVENLVRKSSGQFIYASTVIKFVESPRHRPTDRLDIIFGLKTLGKQVPFAELDALYRLIFLSAENIEAVLEVFAFRLLFPSRNNLHDERLGIFTPYVIENFLGYQPGELQIILADLHSAIFVPSPSLHSPWAEPQLRIFHASLGDFLFDRSRSGDLFIDASKAHARMAEICIQHMIPIVEMGGKLKSDQTHLNIACKHLMTQCMSAYPTKRLLHQLSSFIFDQYLSFASEYSNSDKPWDVIANSLPGFIRWLQQQCPTSHTEGCLCRCYMAHFDNFILKKLSVLPPLDPTFQCMLTIFTFDSIHGDAYLLASNICQQPDPVVQRQLDKLRIILAPTGYGRDFQEYSKMMQDFFTDQARSKSHYRNKSKYIELAVILLQYFTHQHSLRVSTQDRDCSTIAQEILSCFPREPRLVKFLRTNKVLDDLGYRQNLVLAIEAYIKDPEYDLGNMEAPPSGPESLDPPVHSEITSTTGSSSSMAMYAQLHSPPAPWEQH